MVLIKRFFKALLKSFSSHLKESIVFESIPSFSDNTKCIYDELKNRGYDKRYYFIWQTKYDQVSIDNNSKAWKIFRPRSLKQILISLSIVFRRKCNIICNAFYGKSSAKEPTFYLCHGTPLKKVKGSYNLSEEIDYIFTSSAKSSKICAEQYSIAKEKCIPLGSPRNDSLIQPRYNIKQLLNTSCDKIIVWYPTYRQTKNYNIQVSKKPLAIVTDEAAMERINNAAKKSNVLIVIKPHFGQDLKYCNINNKSNIIEITDEFFIKNDITSYEFVGASDALLTDYSSVYYDYTICNKPIGLVWEDFEEYSENPGLIDEYEELTIGGMKIFGVDDLCQFINYVAKGNDIHKEERLKIFKLMNNNIGSATKSVTDFIVKNAAL